MHRLLVKTDLLREDEPTLPSATAKHLKVLRPIEGEEIELFDGRGATRCFVWRNGRIQASAAIQTFARPTYALTLFACLTKGSRWDWTIEKATELGVTRIIPVISDRTIVRIAKADRAAKRERWQRIVEDAARQSDAKWLPEMCEAIEFRDVLPLVQETTCFVGALTTPPSPPLSAAVYETLNKETARAESFNLSTFVGPEGDLTPEELDALIAIAKPTSFGSTILRAETAALFATSVLSAALNR